jgi:hypothetical protein
MRQKRIFTPNAAMHKHTACELLAELGNRECHAARGAKRSSYNRALARYGYLGEAGSRWWDVRNSL